MIPMYALITLPDIADVITTTTLSASTMFTEIFPILLFIGGLILGPLFALALGRGLWNGIKGVLTRRKGGRR